MESPFNFKFSLFWLGNRNWLHQKQKAFGSWLEVWDEHTIAHQLPRNSFRPEFFRLVKRDNAYKLWLWVRSLEYSSEVRRICCKLSSKRHWVQLFLFEEINNMKSIRSLRSEKKMAIPVSKIDLTFWCFPEQRKRLDKNTTPIPTPTPIYSQIVVGVGIQPIRLIFLSWIACLCYEQG